MKTFQDSVVVPQFKAFCCKKLNEMAGEMELPLTELRLAYNGVVDEDEESEPCDFPAI